MTPPDPDYIHFVHRHFQDLQGLRTAFALGLVLIGFGLVHPASVWPLLILLSLAFVGFGSVLANRQGRVYYQRRFGEVERLPAADGAEPSSVAVQSPAARRPVNPLLRWFLAPVVVALGLFVALRAVSPSTAPPAAVSGPFVTGPFDQVLALGEYVISGACFVGVWLWRERRLSQSYYLVLGILLLGLAALGIFLRPVLPTLRDLGLAGLFLPMWVSLSLADLLCGTLLVVVGLLDHLQLVRVLRPAMEEPS